MKKVIKRLVEWSQMTEESLLMYCLLAFIIAITVIHMFALTR